MNRLTLSKYVDLVFETEKQYSQWGGYYNYDFLNEDKSKLLCNRVDFDGRAVKKGDIVTLGWYDIHTNKYHRIDESDSFNWQQAAMLQWLPCSASSKVVFNTSSDGKIISRIVNIATGEQDDLPYPIYCITPDGKYAITLNFERNYWTPAYHYQSVARTEYDVDVLHGDGIYSIDLESKEMKLIISIDDVLKMKPEERFNEGKHWLEHIMISPSGKRMVFLHRYCYQDTPRLTRLVITDIDGNNMQVIDGWEKYWWSHFGWRDDDSFVIYARKQTAMAKVYGEEKSNTPVSKSLKRKIQSLIRVVYRKTGSKIFPAAIKRRMANKNEYQFYSFDGELFKLSREYTGRLLDIDGHPSFAQNGKYMVTDSYPDENKYRRLLVMNVNTGKTLLIAKFYTGFYGTPAACDLHPKLSKSGDYIAVDTTCNDIHQMMVLKLHWSKIMEKI